MLLIYTIKNISLDYKVDMTVINRCNSGDKQDQLTWPALPKRRCMVSITYYIKESDYSIDITIQCPINSQVPRNHDKKVLPITKGAYTGIWVQFWYHNGRLQNLYIFGISLNTAQGIDILPQTCCSSPWHFVTCSRSTWSIFLDEQAWRPHLTHNTHQEPLKQI